MSARITACSKSCCAALISRRWAAQCWEITWRPEKLSASFHGRDLFAPVAARLARGEKPETMARSTAPVRFADWPDDLAEIVYIDHYGNAMTGMRGETVAATATLVCGGRTIAPARTFLPCRRVRHSGTSIRTGWSKSPSMAAGPTG